MKKSIALFFALIMLVSMLSGCGCDHDYSSTVITEATCSSGGTTKHVCSLCGDTYMENTPSDPGKHSYSSTVTKEATVSAEGVKTYTCSLCGDSYTESIPKVKGNWEIGYFLDNFGDNTSDAYVVGKFTGTFSNSATTRSNLDVYIYVDKSSRNWVQIRLLEYGSHKATFTSSVSFIMETKDEFGKGGYYRDLQYLDGDLFLFDEDLLDEILNSSQLSVYIETYSKYQTIPDKYNFKINNAGLKELYEQT